MQNRRVQIAHATRLFDRFETQLVRGADGLTPFDTRASQPHGEAVPIVIAARLPDAFAGWGAAEFTAPDQERFIPQAASFQVRHQRGNRFVGFPGVKLVVLDAIVVAIPGVFDVAAARIKLDEAHTFFEEASRDEALSAEIRGALVVHEGKITYPPPTPPPAPEPGVATHSATAVVAQTAKNQGAHSQESDPNINPLWLILAGAALLGIGLIAPSSKLGHFTVFMLACFVGWQLVWSVKPALHTPLMSVTNAISGIILVGGMLQLTGTEFNLTGILGAIAVLIATINIAGGFLVTNRMLAMFRKQ